MQFLFDNFNFLSPKLKRLLKDNDIFGDFVLFLSSMFEYEGFDEEINTDFIEFYNILSPMACCGIFNYNGHQVLGYCTEGGLLNEYGQPSMFNINTFSTQNKQGVLDGVNGAICWNNKIHRNDLVTISRYTELLSLSESAQKCLLKYGRLFPVFQVNDSNVEQEIKRSIKNAENGEPVTFTTKALSKLGVDGQPGVIVTQLGDITAFDKIQYLTSYHNELLRRFYSMFGMGLDKGDKRAQQSVEEVTSENKVAWIIPNDRLNERQKFVESYNKVFNRNATVRYSKAWVDAYEEFLRGGKDNEEMANTKSDSSDGNE